MNTSVISRAPNHSVSLADQLIRVHIDLWLLMLLVILAIVVLVFGAAKLPDLARGTGQALIHQIIELRVSTSTPSVAVLDALHAGGFQAEEQ